MEKDPQPAGSRSLSAVLGLGQTDRKARQTGRLPEGCSLTFSHLLYKQQSVEEDSRVLQVCVSILIDELTSGRHFIQTEPGSLKGTGLG